MIAKADAAVIKREGVLADYDALSDKVYDALDDDADADADKRIAMTTDSAAIPVGRIPANTAKIRRGKKAPANYLSALGHKMNTSMSKDCLQLLEKNFLSTCVIFHQCIDTR